MKMPARDSSLPSHLETYDLIIIGAGKRASSVHLKACDLIVKKNVPFKYTMIASRSFLELRNINFRSKIWVLVVPPKFRLLIYLKILKSFFYKEDITILVETPSGIVDVFFSIIPFIKVRIAEVASLDITAPKPKISSKNFSYIDNRFGLDHSYAIYFRYLKYLKGFLFLIQRCVSVNTKKDDTREIEIAKNNRTHDFYISAKERFDNELSNLSAVYIDLINNYPLEALTTPIYNIILKRTFVLFAKKF